jgi:hypothetical protein
VLLVTLRKAVDLLTERLGPSTAELPAFPGRGIGRRRSGDAASRRSGEDTACAWPRTHGRLSFLLDRMLGDNRDGTCEVALREVDYLVGFHYGRRRVVRRALHLDFGIMGNRAYERDRRYFVFQPLVSGGGQTRSAYTVVCGRSQSTFSRLRKKGAFAGKASPLPILYFMRSRLFFSILAIFGVVFSLLDEPIT